MDSFGDGGRMAEEPHTLLVATRDREAFALCLALGTLEAVRSGAWPAEAGIWTIARPVFRGPLETAGLPEDVLAVFRGADELSALETLGGRDAVDRRLAEWVAVLQARLAALPERSWYACWSGMSQNAEQNAAADGGA